MRVIVAPDKFKGSLTSFEVCSAIVTGIRAISGNIGVTSFPMADGGDGFAAVLKHYFKTETIFCPTVDPLQRPMEASYEWDETTRTAIIEVAAASGLVLLKEEERNTLLTSTYGTGLLIADGIHKGAARIILGLGGSATTDAGTGILSALGFIFENGEGNPLSPVGSSLSRIQRIVRPATLPAVVFEIAVDVQNLLYGPEGAAFVYGPQKGADEAAVKQLDEGLKNFSRVLLNKGGRDVAGIPGTGAAGGIAAGLLEFFPVEMKKGMDLVMEASGLRQAIREANLVITGEGKIDGQSGMGKVVGSICALAGKMNIPCVAVCGVLDLSEKEQRKMGLKWAIAVRDLVPSQEEAMRKAAPLVAKAMKEFAKLDYFGSR